MTDYVLFWISFCVIVMDLAVMNGFEREPDPKAACIYPLLNMGYLLHPENIFTPENQGMVAVGAVMTPVCEGFSGERLVLVGSGTVTCNKEGKWTPTPFPECYIAKAGCSLKTFENGVVTLGSSDAQYLSFKCHAGYRLVGTDNISCGLDDGRGPEGGHQWKQTVPHCEKIPPTTTSAPTTTPEPTTTTPIPTTAQPLVKPYKVKDERGYCQGAIWHVCDCSLTCTYMIYAMAIVCVLLAVIVCFVPILYRARNSKPSHNVSVRPNASKFVKLNKVKDAEEGTAPPADGYLVPVASSPEPRYGQQPTGGATDQTLKEPHDYEDCL